MDAFFTILLVILLLALVYLFFNYKMLRTIDARFNEMYRARVQNDIQEFYREMENYSVLFESRINRFKKMMEQNEATVRQWEDIWGEISKSKKGKQIAELKAMMEKKASVFEENDGPSAAEAKPVAKKTAAAAAKKTAGDNKEAAAESDSKITADITKEQLLQLLHQLAAEKRDQKVAAAPEKATTLPAATVKKTMATERSGGPSAAKVPVPEDIGITLPFRDDLPEESPDFNAAEALVRESEDFRYGESQFAAPRAQNQVTQPTARQDTREYMAAPAAAKSGGGFLSFLGRLGRAVSPTIFGAGSSKAKESVKTESVNPPLSAAEMNRPAARRPDFANSLAARIPSSPASAITREVRMPSPQQAADLGQRRADPMKLNPEQLAEILDDLQDLKKRPGALRLLVRYAYPMNRIADLSGIPQSDLEATRTIYGI